MVRRATPTTSLSRKSQARMAVAVREHDHAVLTKQAPSLISELADRVTASRKVFEAERFLAHLDAATAAVPELDDEQRSRLIGMLRRVGLVDLS